MGWERVYKLVRQIPRGRVITYGQVARWLHLRGGARAAGHAMAACPSRQGIPWHRVVGAGGLIRVREPQASFQRQLLRSEGAAVQGLRVNLERHQWLPSSKSGAGPRQRHRRRRGARFARRRRSMV